jgi:hypothetical protein
MGSVCSEKFFSLHTTQFLPVKPLIRATMKTMVQTQSLVSAVEVIQPADIEEVTRCLAATFMREPMTRVLGITLEEFNHFAWLFVSKAAREGLSLLARDPGTGEVMGCLVAEDFVTDAPEGMETISEKFWPIFSLLGGLDEAYKENNPVVRGQLYHIFMVGVHREYSGSGVIHRLNMAAERLAQQKGYKGAIGEATGPISYGIYTRRQYFKEVDAIAYQDFRFEGKAVFADITDCGSCRLLLKMF